MAELASDRSLHCGRYRAENQAMQLIKLVWYHDKANYQASQDERFYMNFDFYNGFFRFTGFLNLP